MASVLCFLLLLGNFVVIVYGACPTIIQRSAWSQVPPAPNPEKLAVPVDNVIVHHPFRHFHSGIPKSCKDAVLDIQKQHTLFFKYSDIAHNFLVCEDGEVYEGRGWDEAVPHWHGQYSNSIGIAVIGHVATPQAQQAVQQLIACGVETGKIKNTYHLLGYGYNGYGHNKFFEPFHKMKHWGPWPHHFWGSRLHHF